MSSKIASRTRKVVVKAAPAIVHHVACKSLFNVARLVSGDTGVWHNSTGKRVAIFPATKAAELVLCLGRVVPAMAHAYIDGD